MVQKHEKACLIFSACVGSEESPDGWENAIFADDNPHENGIFPRLEIPQRPPKQRRKLNKPSRATSPPSQSPLVNHYIPVGIYKKRHNLALYKNSIDRHGRVKSSRLVAAEVFLEVD